MPLPTSQRWNHTGCSLCTGASCAQNVHSAFPGATLNLNTVIAGLFFPSFLYPRPVVCREHPRTQGLNHLILREFRGQASSRPRVPCSQTADPGSSRSRARPSYLESVRMSFQLADAGPQRQHPQDTRGSGLSACHHPHVSQSVSLDLLRESFWPRDNQASSGVHSSPRRDDLCAQHRLGTLHLLT